MPDAAFNLDKADVVEDSDRAVRHRKRNERPRSSGDVVSIHLKEMRIIFLIEEHNGHKPARSTSEGME